MLLALLLACPTDPDLPDEACEEVTWYADYDGDRAGDDGATALVSSCDAPPVGYTAVGGDCDDRDATVHPGAAEVCDGVDQDCDGTADQGLATSLHYPDGDGDGHGDGAAAVEACAAPAGTVAEGDDCDDDDATVFPGAPERCNTVDDDCDSTVDEDAVDALRWYDDADGDGFGDPAAERFACAAPAGTTASDDDCDDGQAGVHPGAAERCDGVDEDCDGQVDQGLPTTTRYTDADGDGYGEDGTGAERCDAPAGTAPEPGDCDEADPQVHPAALESCNGADDDCDGGVDEDPADGATYFVDADGDGYGDPSTTRAACALEADLTGDDTDCDDTRADTHPDAEETCEGSDEDCNGVADDITSGGTTWYLDADGDGHGSPDSPALACSLPAGYAAAADDCDDAAATTHPGAAEVCGDAVDDDCDGSIVNGCVQTHCGTIAADETWSAGYVHQVTCDVDVQGSAAPTLTLEPGVTVEMGAGTSLRVGWSSRGRLVADGRTAGITITSALSSPLPGDWGYLAFGASDRGSELRGVTVEYAGDGGKSALWVWSNSGGHTFTLDSVTVRDNAANGLYTYAGAYPSITDSQFLDNGDYGVDMLGELVGDFSGNTLTGNALPLRIYADQAAHVDATNDFTGNGDDAVEVLGDTLSASATWRDVGVPWYVVGTVLVEGSAAPTLTIEAGTELQFAADVALEVGRHAAGNLRVEGSAADPVVLTAAQPGTGNWAGVLAWNDAGTYSFEHADVSYGGSTGAGCISNPVSYNPRITVRNSWVHDCDHYGLLISGSGSLDLQDSEVSDNDGYGVYLHWYATLATFSGNTLTGNSGSPLYLRADSLPAMDASNTFAGNGDEELTLYGGSLTSDATMFDYGVPWHVLTDLIVGGSTRPELTLADGAELRFEAGAGLQVGDYYGYGTLSVDAPTLGVLLTSAESSPAPGDWDGLTFTYGSGGSWVRGVEVEYGGANGYAGVLLWNSGTEGRTVTLTSLDVHDNENAAVYCHYCYANVSYASLHDNTGDGLRAVGYSNSVAAFTDATVEDNGGTALALDVGSAVALDLSTVSVLGNGLDGIEFPGAGYSGTGTLADVGLPYVLTSDLTVGSGSSLTIDPGVELQLEPTVGILVTGSGGFSAVGTPSEPIVFTSAQASPAPGDWDGLYFYNATAASLQYILVAYAGGNGLGGVVLDQRDIPFTDSEVAWSSTWGVYRGYGVSGSYTGLTFTGNASGELY